MCMIMTLTSAIFALDLNESILATAIVVVVVVVVDDDDVVVVVVVVVAATAPMPGLMAGESGKDAKSINQGSTNPLARRPGLAQSDVGLAGKVHSVPDGLVEFFFSLYFLILHK